MIIDVDVSCQVSQAYKRTNNKHFPGTAMGFVSEDKKVKYAVFMPKEEVIAYIDKMHCLNKKCGFIKIHCCLIYFCLELHLKDIIKINYCRDFKTSSIVPILYGDFPILNSKNRSWIGGKGNKSKADRFVNHIRKNPTQANRIITASEIEGLLARAPIS